MPMRSPHAAHSRNGSVITHRAAISVPPENRLHSTPGRTPPIRGRPPPFCGRLLKRFASTPAKTHQRTVAETTQRSGASIGQRDNPPHPPTRSQRAPAKSSIPTAPRHRALTRPSSADRRQPTVRGATADSPPKRPGPDVRGRDAGEPGAWDIAHPGLAAPVCLACSSSARTRRSRSCGWSPLQ